MNQQQQQRINRERGWAYLEQQRKEDQRRRLAMDGTPYVPMRGGSVLGSFLKGLFVTLFTLVILAALAFGAFVILNRIGVFN